jgi:tetratricopeptide (TPR) repeat protein
MEQQTEEIATDETECWVCADSTSRMTRSRNRTLMRGCACRGSAGYAHLDCFIQVAFHNNENWDTCPTCKQDFTGKVRLGLARERWGLVRDSCRYDMERLNAADRFASALQECDADNEGALLLFEEVLEISREVDGNDDINTLVSMSNLGSLYQKMGSNDLALPLFEEALHTQRRTMGNDSPDTLRTMSNLATLHLRTEDFGKALPLATDALETRRRILGKDHVDTLESVHNMGLIRWHMAHGEFVSFHTAEVFTGVCKLKYLKESVDFLKRAVEGRSRVLGSQHHQTKSSVRALGYAEWRIKELQNK